MVANKAKASVSVAKPNTLALALGGLAERSNAPDCKSGGRAHPTARGFESYTRRLFSFPGDGANHHQGKKRTAEAARIRKFSIRLLAVNRKEIHGDLSQLQNRDGEGRTWTE